MRKYFTPAITIILLIILCCLVYKAGGQTLNKQLEKEDQVKLQTAFKEWQDVQRAAEVSRLKFQGMLFETMANMKISPKEFELIANDKGEFSFAPKKQIENTPKD